VASGLYQVSLVRDEQQETDHVFWEDHVEYPPDAGPDWFLTLKRVASVRARHLIANGLAAELTHERERGQCLGGGAEIWTLRLGTSFGGERTLRRLQSPAALAGVRPPFH
jgi:hypothetical protein